LNTTDARKSGVDFLVKRDDLRICRFGEGETADGADLQPGQVQLKIEKFAFTANNITYAVFGDRMGYWNFFPAEAGWGRVPVWGFGKVTHSRSDRIATDERFYGFYPASSHLTVEADAGAAGFADIASHRRSLPTVYNQYMRTTTDLAYDEDHENEQMILRPLFMTSFLLADFLEDNHFFAARAAILSSASSKTAYGTAFLLSRMQGRPEVIGLTSPRHAAFTKSLGCYDRVATYDQVDSLPKDAPAVYVDMAGSGASRSSIHRHFGGNLKHSAVVGATHWDEQAPQVQLPGTPPSFFFAPTQVQKRTADWGPGGLNERFGEAWKAFREPVSAWMDVLEERGPDAVKRVYLDHLEGRSDPRTGNVLSLASG
jgi:hypothetical protein